MNTRTKLATPLWVALLSLSGCATLHSVLDDPPPASQAPAQAPAQPAVPTEKPLSELGKTPVAMVFSTEPITSTTLDLKDAKLTNQFVLGQPIYAAMYTTNGKSIATLLTDRSSVFVDLYYQAPEKEDGGPIVFREARKRFASTPAELEKSYMLLPVLPKTAAGQQVDLAYDFVKDGLAVCQKKLAPEFKVRFDWQGWGRFGITVRCDPAGEQAALELAQKARLAVLGSVQLPEAGMRDAALEEEMVRVYNALGDKKQALRAIITSKDWGIQRHETTGHIIGRAIQTVMVTKPTKDSEVCELRQTEYAQQYDGKNFVNLRWNGGNPQPLAELLCKDGMPAPAAPASPTTKAPAKATKKAR